MGLEKEKQLVKKVQGIDLLISSHEQIIFKGKNPKKIAGTWFFAAGDNGFRIGRIEIDWQKNKIKKVKSHLNEISFYDWPDDPIIREMIDNYFQERKKLKKSKKK